ncbi:MAG: D-alanine--D-serine ligase VanG [Clostridia bacterium]
MNKLNVAIIFGGCSSEYEISLKSACSVIRHIDIDKYRPILIGISRTGNWFRYLGNIENIENDTWCNPVDCIPAIISPGRDIHGLLEFSGDSVNKRHIDAAFPVLHGKNGEDGTIQGLLELADIPVIGCATLCSATCMDKDIAHKIAHSVGIRVPRSFVVENNKDRFRTLSLAENIGYPLFVKPVKGGSSYGITKIAKKGDLSDAIKLAFEYDERVLIEEAIAGSEVGCAVLGNDILTVGDVDEIELEEGFFDFNKKYSRVASKIHIPARIDEKKAEEVKLTAKAIYKALNCRGFARVDMFLTPKGEIVFNEVNTTPGLSNNSRYPNMLKAIGMTFKDIVSAVIDLAVKK